VGLREKVAEGDGRGFGAIGLEKLPDGQKHQNQ
jgi:hypothetical protein